MRHLSLSLARAHTDASLVRCGRCDRALDFAAEIVRVSRRAVAWGSVGGPEARDREYASRGAVGGPEGLVCACS